MDPAEQSPPSEPSILLLVEDAGHTGDDAGLPAFVPGEPRLNGIGASVRF